jgi:hypothetical protein
MRVSMLSLTIATALFASASAGNARVSQPCIPKATAGLPHLPKLSVKQTRTRPVSAAVLSTWRGQSRPIIVDIDFVADGTAETYSFMCVITRDGTFVQRTIN